MLQLQLIARYDYVCRYYATQPALHFQRQSNNSSPAFTDQELMTVYLFGLLKKRPTLRLTYDYIIDHWLDWFPNCLPMKRLTTDSINLAGTLRGSSTNSVNSYSNGLTYWPMYG